MADRVARRPRRINSPPNYDEGDDSTGWDTPSRIKNNRADSKAHDGPVSAEASTRSRRAAAAPAANSLGGIKRGNSSHRGTVATAASSSITVERQSSSPVDTSKKSLLKFKMPSKTLREATSGGKKEVTVNSRDSFEPGEIVNGPRTSRAKRPIVESSQSEEVEDDELVLDDDDELGEDEDAEDRSEDVDADGDVEMEDAPPPPPTIKAKSAKPFKAQAKPTVTVTLPNEGKLKPIETKEMDFDDDDDDELSELESEEGDEESPEADAEAEDADGDEEGVEDNEDDEEEDDDDDDEEEEEEDSDDDGTPATGSRYSTPDLSKLTKRQRGLIEQTMTGDLLELPAESKLKKVLTAEEHAMRRAELARRRKNLSEKRNEEEKMDTINKLLKKQAPKRRGRAAAATTARGSPGIMTPNLQDNDIEKQKPNMLRWVCNRDGSRMGVPEEWLGTPAGTVFKASSLQNLKVVKGV